jgi:hypothetical protein
MASDIKNVDDGGSEERGGTSEHHPCTALYRKRQSCTQGSMRKVVLTSHERVFAEKPLPISTVHIRSLNTLNKLATSSVPLLVTLPE